MNDKIRRFVLPNIPYPFIFRCCLKLGAARLEAEAGFGKKLIGMIKAIGPAFQTIAPDLVASEAKPGDLVFFKGPTETTTPTACTHLKLQLRKKIMRNCGAGFLMFSNSLQLWQGCNKGGEHGIMPLLPASLIIPVYFLT